MKGKIEYYTLRPQLKQIYGKRVDENTKFTEKTEDGTVEQSFENLTLTTRIKKKSEFDEYKTEEESVMKVTMPKGTILIWSETEGFIIPQYQMCTLEDIEEDIRDIKEIYKDNNNQEG